MRFRDFTISPYSVLNTNTDVDLKARIDAFLAERKNKNTVYDKPESEIVNMDKEMDTAP